MVLMSNTGLFESKVERACSFYIIGPQKTHPEKNKNPMGNSKKSLGSLENQPLAPPILAPRRPKEPSPRLDGLARGADGPRLAPGLALGQRLLAEQAIPTRSTRSPTSRFFFFFFFFFYVPPLVCCWIMFDFCSPILVCCWIMCLFFGVCVCVFAVLLFRAGRAMCVCVCVALFLVCVCVFVFMVLIILCRRSQPIANRRLEFLPQAKVDRI